MFWLRIYGLSALLSFFSPPLFKQILLVLQEIGRDVAEFRSSRPTPERTHAFEERLGLCLRELGRVILENVYNQLEKETPELAPGLLIWEGEYYRRRGQSPTEIATLFGKVILVRYLYQPVESAGAVIRWLETDHGVKISVSVLRKIIASIAEEMTPFRHSAQVAKLLKLLREAYASRGNRKPVLSVGRDGIFLPIRGEKCYREAATATVTVYDRRGHRLGTVYLGSMPESLQATLSNQLTQLLTEVLQAWTLRLPRLVYVTDGGSHPEDYYRNVLDKMVNPHATHEYLVWERVIDFYHASGYVTKLAEALFGATPAATSWARRMRRWLQHKPKGIYRVLHSAAAIRPIHGLHGSRQEYRAAYDYFRRRIRFLNYAECRRLHIPIGSGVTEAACKTVFTQRFKQSGMTWSVSGGATILPLRVMHLSGVWDEIFAHSLKARPLPYPPTEAHVNMLSAKTAA